MRFREWMKWAAWLSVQVALTVTFKLGEHAVVGWGDEQIAATFGLSSPTLSTVIGWLPPFLGAALILVAYHFVQLRLQNSRGSAETKSKAPSAGKLLEIVVDVGPPYERVERVGANRNRTIRVKLQNNSDHRISNGRLRIEYLDPPHRDQTDFLIKGDITMDPQSDIFVDVLYYPEGTSSALPGEWIGLYLPIAGGFFAEAIPKLSLQGSSFQLRFEGDPNLTDTKYCEAWVDDNHKLHLTDLAFSGSKVTRRLTAEPVSRQTVSSDARISLLEAATRAYEQTRHLSAGQHARALSNSNDEILSWYCYALALPREGAPLVRLYGSAAPSRIIEPLDPTMTRSQYDIIMDGGAFILKERYGPRIFQNLSVDPKELTAAITEISSWQGTHAGNL